jgi:hypothetical protein
VITEDELLEMLKGREGRQKAEGRSDRA